MTATVSIIIAERNDALRISNIALRFKADPEDNGLDTQAGINQMGRGEEHLSNPHQKVWMLCADGKPRSVLLEVGISDERYTEIRKGPVKEGERVIVGYRSQDKQDAGSEQSRFRLRLRR
jgi:HlyD family secretion protein